MRLDAADQVHPIATPIALTPSAPTRTSVVVPTRNEAGNVQALYERLSHVLPGHDWELVFVDDSDDQTPDVLAALAATDARVRYVHRTGAERTGGLGGAVMCGVARTTSELVVVMDGDLQHPPETVPSMVQAFDDPGVDLVVGSRHVADGSSGGLSNAFRHVASRVCQAVAYAAVHRSRATSDPLSGFFAFRRHVVQDVHLQPDGYKILLEVLARGRWNRCRDVAFRFAARTSGESKSDIAEARRYLRHVLALRTSGRAAARARVATEVLQGGGDSAPLRVMLFTSEVAPVVSGISTCMTNLHTTLTARGHEVDMVSRADFARLERREVRLSAFALSWPRFRRRLADYDIVNVHGPVPTMSDVFLLLSRTLPRHQRPTIVYTHHSDIAIPGVGPLCWLYNRVTPWIARAADVVLVSTQAYAEKFSHLTSPVEVIPWGVDTSGKVLPREDTAPGRLRVLFVGQLRPYKGVSVLLDAVRHLPGVGVTVVGDGPERADLEATAAEPGLEDVRFVGRVSDEALWQAYSEHDVVILPSLTSAEAYGLVLAEGMAAGCVPVASDLPGVREVAGPTGMLVPPGDAAAIRRSLSALATEPELLTSLAEACIERSRALSVDANGARHEQVFLRALGHRQSALAARAA